MNGLVNKGWSVAFLLVILLLLLVANISMGSVAIPPGEMLKSLVGSETSVSLYSDILFKFRIPKAVTCLLAGSALAVGGLLMQTLFRNPLAGPDVLGLSSGASLMVAFIILLGRESYYYIPTASPWTLALAASTGSALVFLLIMAAAHRIKNNASILIIGLMISAAAGSLVGVLQFVSNARDLQVFTIWTLGNVGSTSWNEIIVLTISLGIGTMLAWSSIKSINAWLLGDNYAQSLGINLKRSRLLIVLATCIMVGGVTAFCGPIAFVGLAVPHLVRMLIPTADHKILIPMVMIGGSALLLFCDILAQLPGSASVLPLNAVTSIIGAPVVIWVVVKSSGIRL
ncbi:MAG: iron ABC transporter permease [Cyclobacteriaceae bacterium]